MSTGRLWSSKKQKTKPTKMKQRDALASIVKLHPAAIQRSDERREARANRTPHTIIINSSDTFTLCGLRAKR